MLAPGEQQQQLQYMNVPVWLREIFGHECAWREIDPCGKQWND